MDRRVPFTLHFGGKLVTEVLCDPSYTDNQVRGAAMAQHERAPRVGLRDGQAPFERAAEIRFAEVRRPGGGR